MMISFREIRKLFQFPTGGSMTLPYKGTVRIGATNYNLNGSLLL